MTPDSARIAKLALGIQRSIVDGELGLEGAAELYALLSGEPAEDMLERRARVSHDDVGRFDLRDLDYLIHRATGCCGLAWLHGAIDERLGLAVAAELAS